MRPLTSLLLAIAVLQLSWPCHANETSPDPRDAREEPGEEQRREHERRRMEQAARTWAAQQEALQTQRNQERYQEESVAAMRRRVGGMALAMAATTGSLTALSLYLGTKGTATGQRSYRPITQGLAGFTVATALLGTGFLLSGLWSRDHDVAVGVGPGGTMLAGVGWRFR